MLPAYRAPEREPTLDLAAHLACLPPHAACKGMFFRDLVALAKPKLSAADLAGRAGIPHRRYVPFLDYPMSENLRLTVEVAKVSHPSLPLGAAVRRIGRTSYGTFLSSHAGRVIASTVGHDIEKMFLLAPKVIKLLMNFGEFHAERREQRCVRIACQNFPAFLETYQVGVFEGVFEHFGVTGTVSIALANLSTAEFEARWE